MPFSFCTMKYSLSFSYVWDGNPLLFPRNCSEITCESFLMYGTAIRNHPTHHFFHYSRFSHLFNQIEEILCLRLYCNELFHFSVPFLTLSSGTLTAFYRQRSSRNGHTNLQINFFVGIDIFADHAYNNNSR